VARGAARALRSQQTGNKNATIRHIKQYACPVCEEAACWALVKLAFNDDNNVKIAALVDLKSV